MYNEKNAHQNAYKYNAWNKDKLKCNWNFIKYKIISKVVT